MANHCCGCLSNGRHHLPLSCTPPQSINFPHQISTARPRHLCNLRCVDIFLFPLSPSPSNGKAWGIPERYLSFAAQSLHAPTFLFVASSAGRRRTALFSVTLD